MENPKLDYNKQSFERVQRFLEVPERREIDLIGQNNIDLELLNKGLLNEFSSRGSLAWPGRQTHNLENKKGQHAYGPEVAGSNPAPGTTTN